MILLNKTPWIGLFYLKTVAVNYISSLANVGQTQRNEGISLAQAIKHTRNYWEAVGIGDRAREYGVGDQADAGRYSLLVGWIYENTRNRTACLRSSRASVNACRSGGRPEKEGEFG